jgi:SnoaL-like domain
MSARLDSPPMLPLRAAMEARDLTAATEAFAPDAVFRSPLTNRLTFTGREQIGALLEVILDVFDGLHYTDELRGGDRAVLVAEARVAGSEIELVDHICLDENGKIREVTVFFRPLPATAVAMGAIGAGLGERTSRGRARAISLLTRPLVVMTAAGDRIGAPLVRASLP